MTSDLEMFEGYVVDIACLRKYPKGGVVARARSHTKSCAVMGHCVESGYALINNDGDILLLEPAITPKVLQLLYESPMQAGIRIQVKRRWAGEGMRTESVDEV